MITNIYKDYAYLTIGLGGIFSPKNLEKCMDAQRLIEQSDVLYFIGNGGSHASCCLHIAEDFIKVARKRAMTLENPSLISCLENDYPHTEVYVEWLKRFWMSSNAPLLIAISSSGESDNIINAVKFVKQTELGKVITFSAHQESNRLSKLGDINFYIPTTNYGAAETYHQLWLHMILDSYVTDLYSK